MKEDHHQLSIYEFREAVKLNSRILIRVCIACYIRLKKYQFLSKNEKDVLKDTGDSRQFKILKCCPRQVAYLKTCTVLCLRRVFIVNLHPFISESIMSTLFSWCFGIWGPYRLPLPGKLVPKDNDNLPTYVPFIYKPANPKFISPTTSLSNSSMASQNFPCPKSLWDQGPSK